VIQGATNVEVVTRQQNDKQKIGQDAWRITLFLGQRGPQTIYRNLRTIANLPRCVGMRQLSTKPKQHLRRLRRQVERLPPYPALLSLAVPLAVVEPLKLATIFIAGEGHWITGGVVMLFAYAISLFVTEWLFVIVKPKLLSLPWFARAWVWFVARRDKTWRWVTKRAD
jgi:hypothetical protein